LADLWEEDDEHEEDAMRFALRRLAFFLGTLWACLTLNFLLPRLMPGNPALALIAKFHGRISAQALKPLEIAFGVNTQESLIHQYFGYLRNTATGNLGTSLSQLPTPVSQIISNALPWTLGLVGVTTLLAFLVGTSIGIVGAWRRGGWLDNVLPPVFVITSAIPFFWIGMLLIVAFSLHGPHLPSSGTFDTTMLPAFNLPFILNLLQHALLPAAAILITSIGLWILTMRNNMVTVLSEDYIKMARAKGLPGRRIMFDYAARNAMLPSLSGLAMSLGFVLGGSVLVEYVFNYPGLGFWLVQAVEGEDYPLMQALFLLITLAVLLAVLLTDVLNAILDPRTRTAG
jgi:peptide/nickel transport system permease protein